MSECPRSLSNGTKAKIRASLCKLWRQRLKWKRSREKFLQLWAESIANAAKTGGVDQQELDWDSYEKIEIEIAIQEQVRAAEEAKEKEVARIQAKRVIKQQMKMKERLAQKMKKQEKEANIQAESKTKMRRKSNEEEEDLGATPELKLKAMLMKIHKTKPIISQISCQHQRAWENLDMELTNREQLLTPVTLAEQIRLAKVKREEYVTQGISTTFSGYPDNKTILQ